MRGIPGGLIKGLDYKFKSDNTVDWRAMVGKEYLVPNRSNFERRNQPVPNSIDGLEDSGLNDLARRDQGDCVNPWAFIRLIMMLLLLHRNMYVLSVQSNGIRTMNPIRLHSVPSPTPAFPTPNHLPVITSPQ